MPNTLTPEQVAEMRRWAIAMAAALLDSDLGTHGFIEEPDGHPMHDAKVSAMRQVIRDVRRLDAHATLRQRLGELLAVIGITPSGYLSIVDDAKTRAAVEAAADLLKGDG